MKDHELTPGETDLAVVRMLTTGALVHCGCCGLVDFAEFSLSADEAIDRGWPTGPVNPLTGRAN